MSRAEPWEQQWKVTSDLAKGGQGTTRNVISVSNAAQCGVLKKLHNQKNPQQRRRMHREVSSLDILAPAGAKVPRVLGGNTVEHEQPDIQLYFVMEFVPGPTLDSVVKSRQSLPLEKSLAFALDLCCTMRSAHDLDVLHRDLKPDNIIVRDFDRDDLVIVDFGLSFNKQGDEDALTQHGETFRNKFILLPET